MFGGGVSDSGVGKGVGEDSFDSDADYEDSSGYSNDNAELSDYSETDVEDEDLYTTCVKRKDMDNVHGNFDWFGIGTSSNVNDGHVVSFDSADSEGNMESLSSDFEEGQATQRKKRKYPNFTEHDLKGKVKLRIWQRFS